jgi:hypothetical protein
MTPNQAALRKELAAVEKDLDEVRRSAQSLRQQIGSDGPADPGDVATLVQGAEEQESLATTLEERRDRLREQLGLDPV